MKKFFPISTALLLIISCAGTANVEFGMNDEGLTLGLFGDLKMRVLEVELYDGSAYQSVWDGPIPVVVSIETADFVSITNGWVTATPGTYEAARLTVDSLQYVSQTSSIMVIDTVMTFSATAFTPIELSDGDETALVVNIKSVGWFDSDSVKIRDGHQPFEGAALKIHYPGN